MKLFKWLVDYEVKMKDGTIKETQPACMIKDPVHEVERPSIMAPDIFVALQMARDNILFSVLLDPEVEKAVITDIGIADLDVFEGDPDPESDRMKEIREAMKALGYHGAETMGLELKPLDDVRVKVICSGHLTIGIYDFVKHTFVD